LLCLLAGHDDLSLRVELKPEQIRPGIVADHVEIELSTRDLSHVQLGDPRQLASDLTALVAGTSAWK
jgi:hypothetical protein